MKQNPAGKLTSKCSSGELINTYYLMFGIFLATFLLCTALSRGKYFQDVLFFNIFTKNSDQFMDFFNSIRDAGTKEVFKNGIIYPPLANMIYYLISRLISPEQVNLSFQYRFLIRDDQVSMVLLVVITVVTAVLFSKVIDAYFQKRSMAKPLISVVFMLSFPFIYCIERGNCALFALVLSMFFVFFRDSENKYIRELSYICLAFAAGIKIYPALFGLLLITDKKYRQAARLAVYGFFMFFLPFFFYDGFESILDVVLNIVKFSVSRKIFSLGDVSTYSVLLLAGKILGIPESRGIIIAGIVFALTEMLAAAAVFILPKGWQKQIALIYLFMNVSAVSNPYNMVFFLIPFSVFLTQKEEYRKIDIVYFLMFALILLPLPAIKYFSSEDFIQRLAEYFSTHSPAEIDWKLYIENYSTKVNQLVAFPIMQVLLTLLTVESVRSILGRFRGKKRNEATAEIDFTMERRPAAKN